MENIKLEEKLMKTFNIQACQGDLLIQRIDALPKHCIDDKSSVFSDHIVLAHSETGHHHVVDSSSAKLFIDSENPFVMFLHVEKKTELSHLRNFDRHESLLLDEGFYQVRRQREYVSEGFRPAQD